MFRTHGDVTRISVRTPMRAVSVNETSRMPHDPHLFGILITTTCLGLAMTCLAARLSMIEARRPEKCPACGRQRISGGCGCPPANPGPRPSS